MSVEMLREIGPARAMQESGVRSQESGSLAASPLPLVPSSPPPSSRSAFTLVELLVAITIIGILSSIALAALSRARQAANVVNTKSTIAKLHTQIQTKWDSYRIRKPPVDINGPINGILTKMAAATPVGSNYPYVMNWLTAWGVANTTTYPPNPNNNRQVAAVRLLAMRELQRYEMPTNFQDFAVQASGGAFAPPFVIRPPVVLASPPSMAYTYLRKLNTAVTSSGAAPTTAQLLSFDTAECLYMVVTSGLEDVAFGGDVGIPKNVGDADGDGLPEFQDAWTLAEQQYPVSGPQRQPISWVRWPAGFHTSAALGLLVSDLDPDPTLPNCFEFSVANHDYFDTLKLDVPPAAGPPRGFAMMPLVYSAGPDNDYGGMDVGINFPAADPNDPYQVDPSNGRMLGQPTTPAWTDNIHNHMIEAR